MTDWTELTFLAAYTSGSFCCGWRFRICSVTEVPSIVISSFNFNDFSKIWAHGLVNGLLNRIELFSVKSRRLASDGCFTATCDCGRDGKIWLRTDRKSVV